MAQEYMDQTSEGYDDVRPVFYIGQHDSARSEPPTDLQYGQILNAGFGFTTTPVTNRHFYQRIQGLVASCLGEWEKSELPSCHPDPIVPPLTIEDTALFPDTYTSGLVAYSSPWIDLCSPNPVVSSISRQVLNLEVNYANFCGIRSLIVPGPRNDALKAGSGQGVAQFARAIQEALVIGTRLNFIIHLPMYREPGLEETIENLSSALPNKEQPGSDEPEEIDIFSTWDSWNVIRTTCTYDSRLSVAVRVPRVLPEKQVQTRWFSEPLQYLTFGPSSFQPNKSGNPSLSKHHQEMIGSYMKLKHAPYFLLCDVGPELKDSPETLQESAVPAEAAWPSLSEASQQPTRTTPKYFKTNPYASYLRYVESQQEPLSALERSTLSNFQDWLQSPLQPLSDNLESVTYEVFEGDPVKYNQYEAACAEALTEWAQHKKPTSSSTGAVVIAVAGSGRGPLVTRALKASETTGVPVQVWAVEKNPNAYVYLLRQNQRETSGVGHRRREPLYGKVDILISELLGSFGDNELSPECLDGIQHVLAKPHGISIPKSYTAHMSPISTPRIHADISQRLPMDPHGFETPWVVRLFQLDFVAEKVPGHARFQQAWEFVHPLPESTMTMVDARRSGGVVGGGGGSMAGGVGANDHNSRHCHLTFVCRSRGVIHGLAGYFESVLYEHMETGKTPVELSTLPNNIDRKSKDMISLFYDVWPKTNVYAATSLLPPDTELEVSMWRQTDDKQVWYEWMVEAFAWVGPTQRIKVGGSEMCSSRKIACLM
ncbi:PRMT5 arginine-N-methyltransferase [Apiospora hydei]|uniref:Protein arginine N-methyltransferase n=1 Tax=Apiospora hydei TaxID=1337664 RepID=A0ABR1XBV0_9PEZI